MRKYHLPTFCILEVIFAPSCPMNDDTGAIMLARKVVKEKPASPTTAMFDNEVVMPNVICHWAQAWED